MTSPTKRSYHILPLGKVRRIGTLTDSFTLGTERRDGAILISKGGAPEGVEAVAPQNKGLPPLIEEGGPAIV